MRPKIIGSGDLSKEQVLETAIAYLLSTAHGLLVHIPKAEGAAIVNALLCATVNFAHDLCADPNQLQMAFRKLAQEVPAMFKNRDALIRLKLTKESSNVHDSSG